MGILNLSVDSFSHDGRLSANRSDVVKNVEFAQTLIRQGADIIDVGGESTRPGAKPVTPQEEIKRVIPTLKMLAKSLKKPISVDTYKPLVMQHALDNGASIVNDVMGTSLEPALLKMVKRYQAGIVLMHIRGIPLIMQRRVSYNNLMAEIIASLHKSVEKCLETGIQLDRIVLDPGIGFGKTVSHNLEIIKRLREFQILGRPILVGTSRKSFIGKVLKKEVGERLVGTLATVSASILNGAHIVRAHDVGAVKETAVMIDAICHVSRVKY